MKAFGDGGGANDVTFAQAANDTRIQWLQPDSSLHYIAFLLHVLTSKHSNKQHKCHCSRTDMQTQARRM